jgi:hypothetical protein
MLHAAYAGDKNFISFDGDHNSQVPVALSAILCRSISHRTAPTVLLHFCRNILPLYSDAQAECVSRRSRGNCVIRSHRP